MLTIMVVRQTQPHVHLLSQYFLMAISTFSSTQGTCAFSEGCHTIPSCSSLLLLSWPVVFWVGRTRPPAWKRCCSQGPESTLPYNMDCAALVPVGSVGPEEPQRALHETSLVPGTQAGRLVPAESPAAPPLPAAVV